MGRNKNQRKNKATVDKPYNMLNYKEKRVKLNLSLILILIFAIYFRTDKGLIFTGNLKPGKR